ncbi:N-acetylmuramoyl-L-alanine amidase [Paenibacillus tyrfis]|uniref:N-acetylmuramoyl-L-alanine amidase n=1 Tax=Paenibacillus tyrfis TaxID=1501230 RepID=UPI000B597BEC|nr:N-acetylmuramoyl-L-alanine amidase [Paenibacillus tyrfis]
MTREIIWKGNEFTNSNDRGGNVPVAIVNHISAGTMSSMDSWFRSSGNQVSSAHFGVSKDGRIHQYVKIERMAWANGITADRFPYATASIVNDFGINPNLYTVSIEHEGTDGELTEEQFQASVWLHRYIRQYVRDIWGKEIPFDEYHVIGHFQIDPIRKPNCPGPKFPWSRLYAALKNEEEEDDMAKLDQGVAQTLINSYLKPSWEVADGQEKAAADTQIAEAWKTQKNYYKWLANSLRDASGLPRE